MDAAATPAAAVAEQPPPPAVEAPPAAPAAPTAPTPSQRSVVQKSQLQGSIRDGLPSEDTLNENTLEGEPPNPADVGEYTGQLSDVSDGEDEGAQRTASRNALSTWYRRIQPLIRNKRVRVFAIINTILTILNLILFIGCMVILGFLIFEAVEVNNRSQQDKPCIFQWTEWSACPATCASGDKPPLKTRQVNRSSIIQARGNNYKPCPKGLESRKDYAPCNTHRCPIKLSSVTEWTNCFKKDVTDASSKCYQMRNLTIGDYLVEIDTTELTKECECSLAVN
uniref:Uncharacterized protein n=1 Tax=Panagrolaimus sp. PS1159 TaxID=55785 RepID=A0AC35EVR1_9BILA